MVRIDGVSGDVPGDSDLAGSGGEDPGTGGSLRVTSGFAYRPGDQYHGRADVLLHLHDHILIDLGSLKAI